MTTRVKCPVSVKFLLLTSSLWVFHVPVPCPECPFSISVKTLFILQGLAQPNVSILSLGL